MEDNSLIKIKSKEGEIFSLEEKSLEKSKVLKELINDYPDQEIPLNEVDSKTLKKIIEYLKHYTNENPKEIKTPLENGDLKPLIPEFDYKFVSSLTLEECIDIVNAANHMDISGLVDLMCVKLASEMINCDVEEARKKFGIECDMTPEENAEYDKYPLD